MSSRDFDLICITIADYKFIGEWVIIDFYLLILERRLLFQNSLGFAPFDRRLYQTDAPLESATRKFEWLLDYV